MCVVLCSSRADESRSTVLCIRQHTLRRCHGLVCLHNPSRVSRAPISRQHAGLSLVPRTLCSLRLAALDGSARARDSVQHDPHIYALPLWIEFWLLSWNGKHFLLVVIVFCCTCNVYLAIEAVYQMFILVCEFTHSSYASYHECVLHANCCKY